MLIDQFITDHINEMKNVCAAYLGQSTEADDLLQEASLILLKNRNNPKTIQAIERGEGMYYFAGIVCMMATRRRHKFRKTFLSPPRIIHEEYLEANYQDPQDTQRLNEVDDIISSMRWYKRELWRLYFDERYSFTKLSEETGISRKTLYNDITKLKQEVKERIHESRPSDTD